MFGRRVRRVNNTLPSVEIAQWRDPYSPHEDENCHPISLSATAPIAFGMNSQDTGNFGASPGEMGEVLLV